MQMVLGSYTDCSMTFPNRVKACRLLHHYTGVFFAPAILFFAITGTLQMFGLHETSRGSTYVPPVILTHLAQLHKKGTPYLPPRRPSPPAAPKSGDAKPDPGKQAVASAQLPAAPEHNPLPTKIFFGLTGLALVTSTCTGLYLAWKYTRTKLTVLAVFLAGVVVPLILLAV